MYFPLKPRHRLHEPAHGYVLRLVEANGYAWRGCKLREVGANLANLANGIDLEFARLHGRADIEHLVFSTPRRCEASHYRMCGQILHRSQLVFGRKRFCTACWIEDRARPDAHGPGSPYLRCWWSVAAVTACPIHSVKLTDRCFVCDRGTTFESGGLTTCRCGADLVGMRSKHVPYLDSPVDRFVLGRLGGLPPTAVPILDEFGLGDAILLLQRLGCIARPGYRIDLADVAQQDRGPLAAAGLALCLSGDEGVESALGGYLDATGRTDAFKSAFGSFYKWVRELESSPSRTWLMDRLASVFNARRIHWTHRRGDGSHAPMDERVNVRAAGKLLDLSHVPTRRVLEFTGLLQPTGSRHIRHTVERAEVLKLRRMLDRLIGVPTAASKLGINARSVIALSTAGIIPGSTLGRQAFGNAMMFDPDDLDAFLTRLRGSAEPVACLPAGGQRLPDASRSRGMVELCRRILDGSISTCASIVGETGLKAIVVGPDARRWFDGMHGDPLLSLSAVRRRLGLREATMAGLLAEGHIRAESAMGSRKLVRFDVVESFAARYVSSSELAQTWQTSTTEVLRRMRRANCSPAIEFLRGDRIEKRFFERAMIAGAAAPDDTTGLGM